MNKESIYRIIGYHGKYTDNVKKALRKLLKENHPDYHGDKEVFQLINEVKEELETNQVSFKSKDNETKNYDDIDLDYCRKMISKLEKEKKTLINEINQKKEIVGKLSNDYKSLYRNSINEADKLLKVDSKKLKGIKNVSIIMLIVLVVSFIMAIVTQNIFVFILFGILCFIFILIIEKYFTAFYVIRQNSEKSLKKYVYIVNNIDKNIDQKSELLTIILELERKLKKVENDLRFYNNLLK